MKDVSYRESEACTGFPEEEHHLARKKGLRSHQDAEPALDPEFVRKAAPNAVLYADEVSGLHGSHDLPSKEDVAAGRKCPQFRQRYRCTLCSTIYALIIVAAVDVLIANLFLPVLQVSGSGMGPTGP